MIYIYEHQNFQSNQLGVEYLLLKNGEYVEIHRD